VKCGREYRARLAATNVPRLNWCGARHVAIRPGHGEPRQIEGVAKGVVRGQAIGADDRSLMHMGDRKRL
jgi:hypothetical protein